MVDEREIQDIIERTRRRVGEPGPAARAAGRASARSSAGRPRSATGDGVYATLDEAVAARRAAYAASPRLDLDTPQGDDRGGARARRSSRPRRSPGWPSRRPASGGSTTRPPRTGWSRARRRAPRTSRSRPSPATDGMMITEFAPFGVVGRDHAGDQPRRDGHQQRDLDRLGGQRGRVQRPPVGAAGVERGRAAREPGDRRRPAARRTSSVSTIEPTIESARDADDPPRRPAADRDRRPGRRARGAQDRQAGDHRRARATRRRSSTRPPTWRRPARDIVRGASFDNNIVCTDEKEVIVVASVADRLRAVDGARTAPTSSPSTSCGASSG